MSRPVVCLSVAFVLLCLACAGSVRRDPVKTMTRQEFNAAVIGKTPDEVLQTVGKPDSTSTAYVYEFWYYTDHSPAVIILDPVTGQRETQVQVVFEKGRVTKVNH